MKKDRSLFLGLGFIVVVLLIAYVVHSYTSIFERRVGYIYDPKSDDVFSVQLAPYLSPFKKWEIFNPLKSISYSRPDGAEYLGKLHEIIEEFREDQNLLETNPEEWSRKFDAEISSTLDAQESQAPKIVYWDIDYFPQRNKQMKLADVLPRLVEADLPSEKLDKGAITMVDAVITRREVTIGDQVSFSPTSIDIVKGAVLFKAGAAYALSREGL